MPKAVRYDGYGAVDVLQVVEVPRPVAAVGEVLIEVVAAAINPGEASIRRGLLHDRWPSTFPSGQGSDLAGRVVELGPGVVEFAVGDEVIGFSDRRSSHAEFVTVPVSQVTAKPADLPWEVAGSLYVAGTTAIAAVRAVGVAAGETIVVSGAAGGVGSLAVQLARQQGARVIGIAGPDNAEFLRSFDVEPLTYGDGLIDRLRALAPEGVDAFIDTFGADYVEIALALGVRPERIDTIVNFAAAQKYGVKSEGNAAAATAEVIAELAGRAADHRLVVPIAAVYPLDRVQAAFTELEKRHTRGKIVLRMDARA